MFISIILLCFLIESFGFVYFDSKNMNRIGKIKMSVDKNSLNEVIDIIKSKEKNSGYAMLSTLRFEKNLLNYPYISQVGFAITETGFPIFCFSKISKHTRNLVNSEALGGIPKASIQIRDWSDFEQLASQKRITLTGDIHKIGYDGVSGKDEYWDELISKTRELYLKNHPDAYWIDLPDFEFYRMDHIKEIYYIGGFEKATKISVKKYLEKF